LRVDNATTGELAELAPVFDQSNRQSYILDTTTTDNPSVYWLKPGTNFTLVLANVPSSVKTYYVCYWAIPSIATLEGVGETVPLIPSQYHHVLADGLRMDILEFLYGPESDKFKAAAAAYAMGLQKAAAKFTPTVQRVQKLISGDDADYIQST
jgi:hypothetical protein